MPDNPSSDGQRRADANQANDPSTNIASATGTASRPVQTTLFDMPDQAQEAPDKASAGDHPAAAPSPVQPLSADNPAPLETAALQALGVLPLSDEPHTDQESDQDRDDGVSASAALEAVDLTSSTPPPVAPDAEAPTDAEATTPPANHPDKPLSAWTPLREPVFRMLWGAWFTANVCMWMNDVAAAWLMTSLSTSPVMVALVQSASTLPMLLLGLPSGALADILDRRKFLIVTQFWAAGNATVLCVAAWTNSLDATLLLVLTFTNGIGLAMRWPVFSAIVPELVPRNLLPVAIAMNGIAMNASRIIGPIVAGALIAGAGSHYVFLLNAILSLGSAIVVIRWRRVGKVNALPGERFLAAIRVGLQHVRQSARMRSVLIRVAIFFLQSTALLALLPLEAKRLQSSDGAALYTMLLAALGLGAVTAAVMLPRLRAHMTRNELVQRGTIVQALAAVIVSFAPNVYVAAPAMFLAGMAWISVANSLTVSAQLALPDWVRARGMSIYQMTLMGATAFSAALWGKVASATDVQTSLIAASACGLIALVAARRLHVTEHADEDLTPARISEDPVTAYPVDPDAGPILITIEYIIDPARADEFAAVMRESRQARLRQGALSWGLFHDTTVRERYLEYLVDESWTEHLRRFDRFTAADMDLRARRNAFHTKGGVPVVTRYVAQSTAD